MNKIFDQCILLIALALLFILFAILLYEPEPIIYDGFSSRDMYCELPENWREEPEEIEPEIFEIHREFNRKLASVPIIITYPKIVLDSEHRVFLTAYCAEECGWNYSTSSGEICHRSSDPYEPTTCAIDLRYFSYGTLFYVPSEDRLYVAEDTGSGVKGMWIDTYQDDMRDVYSYNTRYETVYTAHIEYYEEIMLSNANPILWDILLDMKTSTS